MNHYAPGSIRVTTYEEAVAVYLNVETVRARVVGDLVLAFRVANGTEKWPREWNNADGE